MKGLVAKLLDKMWQLAFKFDTKSIDLSRELVIEYVGYKGKGLVSRNTEGDWRVRFFHSRHRESRDHVGVVPRTLGHLRIVYKHVIS